MPGGRKAAGLLKAVIKTPAIWLCREPDSGSEW
jgi:ABC-type transporter Mla maintaining outer membrane lipid asymmetry ATPase subunit MlaF